MDITVTAHDGRISVGFEMGTLYNGHRVFHTVSMVEAKSLHRDLGAIIEKADRDPATYYRPYTAEQVQQFIADDQLTERAGISFAGMLDNTCREAVARAFAALGSDESNVSDGIKGTLLELRDVLLGRRA